MDNKTTVERFKELYGFREGVEGYIPQSGELLKYVGDNVILLVYTRSEDGKWSISNHIVKIEWIGNYDPMTGTYELHYSTGTTDKESSEASMKSIRILSQGFSFENPEETGKSLRFIPFSYHYKFSEFQDFYLKLRSNYNSYKTLSISELDQIYKSKDQDGIFQPKYICAVIKLEDGEILHFRITSLAIKHRNGTNYALTIGNDKGRTYTFMISSTSEEYDFSYGREHIGTMKIIDLGNEVKKEN